MFSQVLLKSLPQSVLAPWSAVLRQWQKGLLCVHKQESTQPPPNMKIFVIVWSVAIFFATPVYPWGAEGHQAIGEAARTMLSPKARAEIQKLLGDDDLASIAVWLDARKNVFLQSRVNRNLYPRFRTLPLNLLLAKSDGFFRQIQVRPFEACQVG
jgi:hypothetical protein